MTDLSLTQSAKGGARERRSVHSTLTRSTFFTLLALLALLALLLVSCKKQDGDAKPPDVDYYTCTMHPSVKSKDPKAKCPICSMDLTPVKKKNDRAAERQSVGTSGSSNADEHATDAQ